MTDEKTELQKYAAALLKLEGNLKPAKVTKREGNRVTLGCQDGETEVTIIERKMDQENTSVLKSYLESLGSDGASVHPAVLLLDDETLITEDLKTKGYLLAPPQLDLPHMQAAMSKLAKLHASGHKVAGDARQHNEQQEQDFGQRILGVMQEYKDEIRSGHEEGMQSYADNIPKIQDVQTSFSTLIHDSLSSETFLFKYEDDGSSNIRKKKILDCKLDLLKLSAKSGGPAADLASLFYTSTENELRYDYGPMLLRGYHSELMSALGSDSGTQDYSMDQLYQEFDSSVPAAIALGLNAVSVMKERAVATNENSEWTQLTRKLLAVALLKEAINRRLI